MLSKDFNWAKYKHVFCFNFMPFLNRVSRLECYLFLPFFKLSRSAYSATQRDNRDKTEQLCDC